MNRQQITLLNFCALLAACAPVTVIKGDASGNYAVYSHEGFLHQAKSIGTKITLPNGAKIEHLMNAPDGTQVAKAGISAALAGAVNKHNNITTQNKDNQTAALEGKKVDSQTAIKLGEQKTGTNNAAVGAGLFQKEGTPYKQQ